MASDPVPIYGLVAAIAWVSLVTVEFYERIYRERIERNRETLSTYGDEQLKGLIDDIVAHTKEGATGPTLIKSRIDRILSLKNAQQILADYRNKTFTLLIFTSISCIFASATVGTWTIPAEPGLERTAYVFLGIYVGAWPLLIAVVFVTGYLFVRKMFEFDSQILSISGILSERDKQSQRQTTITPR